MPLTLLADIIAETTAPKSDIPKLLRLCMILAARLKHEPLQKWCRFELEGYPDGVELPPYRVAQARSRGEFIGPMQTWQGTLEIPLSSLPAKLQKGYGEARFIHSAAQYVDLIEDTKADGSLKIPWPEEVARAFGPKTFQKGAQCLSAWIEVSPSVVAGMLDQIKTRILAFALEIEEQHPEAGNVATIKSPIESATVNRIFNTTIHGNVQNYAAGNADVTQSAVANVKVGDWASLEAALRSAGLSDARIGKLRSAVDEDGPVGKGLGDRVKGWLADLTVQAHIGLAGVSVDVVGGLVTQALLLYFGMAS